MSQKKLADALAAEAAEQKVLAKDRKDKVLAKGKAAQELRKAAIPKWRQQYVDPEADELLGLETGISVPPEEDMTVQSFKDDADINVLVRRFGVTGNLPAARAEPFYGDFSSVGTYQEALDRVREAEAAFLTLPGEVRERFRNNPGALISFVGNDANLEEARRMGLVKKPDIPVPPVPPVPAV